MLAEFVPPGLLDPLEELAAAVPFAVDPPEESDPLELSLEDELAVPFELALDFRPFSERLSLR